ncbi:MAG: hypothetical protein ACR2MN_04265 [Acidimicrobiales bacterium]
MPKFTKTVQAFLSEENSLWAIVDALTEEMPGDCSASALGECQQYLADNGIDKKANTIKDYRTTGRFVESASVSQRPVLRAQSVTSVSRFVRCGASQAVAVEAIEQHTLTTGNKKMSRDAVQALFSRPSQCDSVTLKATDPEDWTEVQWGAFDAKVVEATKTLLTAFNVLQRGIYKPSVEATAQLGLIREQDLDGELAGLLGQS